MKTKTMIAVEYFDEYVAEGDDSNHSTMEIFEDIKGAYTFASTVKYKGSFIADFNMRCVYKENGAWNYDDNSNLYYDVREIEFTDLVRFN